MDSAQIRDLITRTHIAIVDVVAERDGLKTSNAKLLELVRGAVNARDKGEQLFDDWYDEARAAIAETE